MTLINVETNYTTGATLTAWPSGNVAYSVALTETLTGLYTAVLDDAYGTVWYAFVGTSAPTTWDGALDAGPKRVFDLNLGKVANAANGGGAVIVTQPVTTDGNMIYPIVIGDDYLAANSRSFIWTIPAINGFTLGSCVCKFGGKYHAKDTDYAWLVTGTVSDAGSGRWSLSFDLPKTATQSLTSAYYVWSVEVSQGGTEITRVKSGKTVQLVEKQT